MLVLGLLASWVLAFISVYMFVTYCCNQLNVLDIARKSLRTNVTTRRLKRHLASFTCLCELRCDIVVRSSNPGWDHPKRRAACAGLPGTRHEVLPVSVKLGMVSVRAITSDTEPQHCTSYIAPHDTHARILKFH